jgi:uncharacterized membrane protein
MRLVRLPYDLIGAFLLTLAGTLASLLEAPPIVRIPLGILLVLALPGFALVCMLFPSIDGPDGVARVALSVALSLATVPIVALVIDRSPWRIERVTISIGLALVSVLALMTAAILRARLAPGERYVPGISIPALPHPRAWTRDQVALGAAFMLAAVLFIYGGFDAAVTRITGQPTTEFALYNAEGKAQFYPRDVTIGEAAEVQISIANHEGKRLRYEVVVGGAGQAVHVLPDLTLDDGQTWQGTVRFTVTQAGDRLPVRFELYRVDHQSDSEPYRQLELLVTGHQPGQNP